MSVKKSIDIESYDNLVKIFGSCDANINIIKQYFNVIITATGNEITISGEENCVNNAKKSIENLIAMLDKGIEIDTHSTQMVVENVDNKGPSSEVDSLETIIVTTKGYKIKPKTLGQIHYVNAIKSHDITFGLGPAGTGKTYLAVALAASFFKIKKIEKIILTRPAVEAGEKLGFLPGDLAEKVDPYLTPLYEALEEFFGREVYMRMIERGDIEIAPLAYMRGRTLSNAFIILDEAQNTTKEQMKMFLTRLGENSKMIINGDLTQVDLPYHTTSGLRHATDILNNISQITTVTFSKKDVVRNKLIQDIIDAYEKDREKQ